MKKWLVKTKNARRRIRDFLEEKGLESASHAHLSRFDKFAHFWLMVAKSFSRNRCPVHATALAYTSLLALIPMLAVAISVSTPFLKNDEGHHVSKWVDRIIDNITPPEDAAGATNGVVTSDSPPAPLREDRISERQRMVDTINDFINKTNSGTVGVTGTILLFFAAISMLARIETTLNDIWGVTHGRTWVARVVQYWAVITLGPVLVMLAIGLANGPRFQATQRLLEGMPGGGWILFRILPILIICLTFGVFYRLMPNTKVEWRAALLGGFIGGVLWHLNGAISVLYVSRWVNNSKFYGSLAAIPVLMVGLYFSWLIVLFGAQVAYAMQNRTAYLQAKQADNVNQRGREFIALRLMECIGQRFQNALPPAAASEIAHALAVPTRLLQQVIEPLLAARLVVEVAGEETAFTPARPLETITCHDILLALRAGQGQELATRDDPARAGVYGEFERILEAEAKAASSVTILTMVNRTEKLAAGSGHRMKAVPNKTTD